MTFSTLAEENGSTQFILVWIYKVIYIYLFTIHKSLISIELRRATILFLYIFEERCHNGKFNPAHVVIDILKIRFLL